MTFAAFDVVDASPGVPITIGVAGWLTSSEDRYSIYLLY